jgi:hypothetical protein
MAYPFDTADPLATLWQSLPASPEQIAVQNLPPSLLRRIAAQKMAQRQPWLPSAKGAVDEPTFPLVMPSMRRSPLSDAESPDQVAQGAMLPRTQRSIDVPVQSLGNDPTVIANDFWGGQKPNFAPRPTLERLRNLTPAVDPDMARIDAMVNAPRTTVMRDGIPQPSYGMPPALAQGLGVAAQSPESRLDAVFGGPVPASGGAIAGQNARRKILGLPLGNDKEALGAEEIALAKTGGQPNPAALALIERLRGQGATPDEMRPQVMALDRGLPPDFTPRQKKALGSGSNYGIYGDSPSNDPTNLNHPSYALRKDARELRHKELEKRRELVTANAQQRNLQQQLALGRPVPIKGDPTEILAMMGNPQAMELLKIKQQGQVLASESAYKERMATAAEKGAASLDADRTERRELATQGQKDKEYERQLGLESKGGAIPTRLAEWRARNKLKITGTVPLDESAGGFIADKIHGMKTIEEAAKYVSERFSKREALIGMDMAGFGKVESQKLLDKLYKAGKPATTPLPKVAPIFSDFSVSRPPGFRPPNM